MLCTRCVYFQSPNSIECGPFLIERPGVAGAQRRLARRWSLVVQPARPQHQLLRCVNAIKPTPGQL